MRIKAFRGYRPSRAKVAGIASKSYDALTSAEARAAAAGRRAGRGFTPVAAGAPGERR